MKRTQICRHLLAAIAMMGSISVQASSIELLPGVSRSSAVLQGTELNGRLLNGPGLVLQGARLNGPGIVFQGINLNGPGLVFQGIKLNGPGVVLQGRAFNGPGLIVQGWSLNGPGLVLQGERLYGRGEGMFAKLSTRPAPAVPGHSALSGLASAKVKVHVPKR